MIDFLGDEINENDNVICLIHTSTSSRFAKGKIIKINPKTVIVDVEEDGYCFAGRERKFNNDKIINLNNFKGE